MGTGSELAFWLLAVLSVASALAVVVLRDVFRAALFLVACFFAVAGIYIILSADFLAAVQVLIYVGAIAVLIIFAIMLTREAQRGSPSNRLQIPALLVGLLLLAVMVAVVVDTSWPTADVPPPAPTTGDIAEKLFDKNEGFVLPFEIASVLLLAAMIGAIVLVRERKEE